MYLKMKNYKRNKFIFDHGKNDFLCSYEIKG